jgi:hypothetical protein
MLMSTLRAGVASSFASLLLSSTTLVCCALPALAVALGAGAVLATFVSVFPFLVTLSMYKGLTFSVAGIGLVAGGIMQYRQRNAPCPADARLAQACMRTRTVSRVAYFASLGLFCVGGFFAFGLPALQAAARG